MDEVSTVGNGVAGDGQVRAAVSADGRLAGLELDPEFLAQGASGVAVAVCEAVNAALDDLAKKTHGDGPFGAFEAQLDQLTAGFEQAIEKATRDLSEAQKRLEK